jgi:hypothetical protein
MPQIQAASKFNDPAVEVLPRSVRIQVIGAGTNEPVRTHAVLFQGRYRDFPVVRVPNHALVYRVDNGRLAAELEELAAQQHTTLGDLRERAETTEVQSLLHGLLVAKSKDPKGPIYQELERLAQQTEPLLVQFDGVIVNGNRRLAAMRQLLAQDEHRYTGFADILVAVLPSDTGTAEVEYVEAALQMAPETKLGYGWIDRRLKLRKQRDELHLPVEQIRAAYRIADPAQIDRELAELALAEQYLAEYCSDPGRYSLVADAEVLFVGLRAQLARLDEAQRRFWCLAGFAMIHGRPTAEAPERYARYFPFSAPVPHDLPSSGVRRLAAQFGIAGADQAGVREESIPEDPAAPQTLLTILRDRDKSSATARVIANTLDELRLESQEHRAPGKLLKRVRQTSRLISTLEPDRLSPEQRRSLRGDLAALQAHAAHLLSALEDEPVVAHEPPPSGRLLRKLYRNFAPPIVQRLGRPGSGSS